VTLKPRAGLWLLVMLLAGWPLSAQSSWCAYKPGTLRAVIDEHQSSLAANLAPGHRNDIISADTRPTRATVMYVGEIRPLRSTDSSFLDGYFLRVVRDTAFRTLFHREVLFVEGSDTLWLPTQDSLIADLQGEVRPGGAVTLFARWLAARQDGPSTRWLFTVNEFATPASQSAWDRVFAECVPS